MHTWIFGGGLVRDDDGAVRILFLRVPLGASRALRQERAFWAILAVGPNLAWCSGKCRIQGFRGWPSCYSSLRASALTTR